MTTVLVVDDEPQIVRALRIDLSARGHEAFTAHDRRTALEVAAAGKPDVVVLDLGMPDIDGVDVIKDDLVPLALTASGVVALVGIVLLYR